MKMVSFYKSKNMQAGHDIVLELYMNKGTGEIDGGALTPFGNKLLETLKTSHIKVGGQKLTFKHREDYLENLHKIYNSPYLTATQYIEQPSKLDLK